MERLGAVLQLLRWHTPTGGLLLFFPCWWGLIAAARGTPPWPLVLWMFLGAVLMRSAGCILNDWVDRDIDRQVVRTQNRPLARGTLSPLTAFLLLGGVLVLAWGVVVHLSASARWVAFGFAGLSTLYPWLKRVTYWPQVYLGVLFSSGIWVGWLALRPAWHDLSFTPLLLYGGSVLWTVSYDTLYAYQDVGCDRTCGVKSSALALGPRPQRFLLLCGGLQTLLWGGVGIYEALNPLFWGGLGVLWAGGLVQVWFLDSQNPERCKTLFTSHLLVGTLMGFSLWWGFQGV
jgi:4-hydroxybenzoate polyprenyl transferase